MQIEFNANIVQARDMYALFYLKQREFSFLVDIIDLNYNDISREYHAKEKLVYIKAAFFLNL